MAQDNSGALVGCGLVLAWLLLAFWPLVVATLAVLAAVGLVVYAVALVRFADLRQIVLAAQRRFAGDVCLVDGCYGLLQNLELQGPASEPHLVLSLQLLDAAPPPPARLLEQQQRLVPPAQLSGLRTNSGVARFLAGHGLTLVNDLAVEAKATRAALECLRELSWSRDALATLQQLSASARSTLAKAAGNELLEPSIPQLQQALAAFEAESQRLQQAHAEAQALLGKLQDFLSVPEAIRPILSFDLNPLVDANRLLALQQSFEDVVRLNDAFRELSRHKLA